MVIQFDIDEKENRSEGQGRYFCKDLLDFFEENKATTILPLEDNIYHLFEGAGVKCDDCLRMGKYFSYHCQPNPDLITYDIYRFDVSIKIYEVNTSIHVHSFYGFRSIDGPIDHQQLEEYFHRKGYLEKSSLGTFNPYYFLSDKRETGMSIEVGFLTNDIIKNKIKYAILSIHKNCHYDIDLDRTFVERVTLSSNKKYDVSTFKCSFYKINGINVMTYRISSIYCDPNEVSKIFQSTIRHVKFFRPDDTCTTFNDLLVHLSHT